MITPGNRPDRDKFEVEAEKNHAWCGFDTSGMLERKTVKYKFKLTAVALANKVARLVFALMTRGGQYDDRPVAA